MRKYIDFRFFAPIIKINNFCFAISGITGFVGYFFHWILAARSGGSRAYI